MTRRWFCSLLVAMLGLGPAVACTKVYNPAPTAPTVTPTPAPTPPPAPQADKIEFRVLGTNLSTLFPVVVRHTDPINGTTLYTGACPTFGVLRAGPERLPRRGLGDWPVATSTLRVQVCVNGKLFRDAARRASCSRPRRAGRAALRRIPMTKRVWVLVGLGLLAGCAAAVTVAPVAPPRLCVDKQPPKLLLQVDCPSGVCGYTCAPGRWPPPVPREPPAPPVPPIPPPEPVLRWGCRSVDADHQVAAGRGAGRCLGTADCHPGQRVGAWASPRGYRGGS
jgi:hypothetical protein